MPSRAFVYQKQLFHATKSKAERRMRNPSDKYKHLYTKSDKKVNKCTLVQKGKSIHTRTSKL